MPTVSFSQFSKGKPVTNLSQQAPAVDQEQQQPGFVDKARDLSTGFTKGLLDTSIGTARLLQNVGQRAIAAVSPDTLEEVKKKYGMESLDSESPSGEAIDEILKSSNNTEKAGKAVEFLAELLFPVGTAAKAAKGSKAFNAAEKATEEVLTKGSEAAGKTFASIKDIGSRFSTRMTDASVPTAIKEKAVEIFTKLDDKTKTALERTDLPKFTEILEQGKNALKDDSITTPLENVGNQLKEALKTVTQKVQRAAVEKGNVLYKTDLYTKPVPDIVDKAITNIDEMFTTVKLEPKDKKFIDKFKGYLEELVKPNGATEKVVPTLGEVDKTIDLLQDMLYKAKGDLLLPKTSRVLGPLRSAIGELNSGAKAIGGDEYAYRIGEVARLTALQGGLNRRLGIDGATAGAFVKRLFSPSDANTKKLLDLVGKETGQDFFRDARLAKFVMDSLGDTRARSLLEGTDVPVTVTGATLKAIQKTADYMIKKTGISDPVKAAEQFIKKYGGKAARNSNMMPREIKPSGISPAKAKFPAKKPPSKASIKRAQQEAADRKNMEDFKNDIPPF